MKLKNPFRLILHKVFNLF